MSMPETTVNEDDCFVFWQNNIRFARQFFVIQSVSKTICEKEFPNQKLWLGVLAFDLAHVVASGLFVVNITHATKVNKAVGDSLLI